MGKKYQEVKTASSTECSSGTPQTQQQEEKGQHTVQPSQIQEKSYGSESSGRTEIDGIHRSRKGLQWNQKITEIL